MSQLTVCRFSGITPPNNQICIKCSLFIHTCQAIASYEGYALGSECGYYYCEGCEKQDCGYKSLN